MLVAEYRGRLALPPFGYDCCGIVGVRFVRLEHLLKVPENFYGGGFVHVGLRLVDFVPCYYSGYYILLVLSNPLCATDIAKELVLLEGLSTNRRKLYL